MWYLYIIGGIIWIACGIFGHIWFATFLMYGIWRDYFAMYPNKKQEMQKWRERYFIYGNLFEKFMDTFCIFAGPIMIIVCLINGCWKYKPILWYKNYKPISNR